MRTSLVARFVLTLQDRLSGPLAAVRRRIEALRQIAGRVALVGTALAGLSVAGPVREAAALEQQMRQTAITAGLSGAAVEEMMARSLGLFQQVARETNQRVRDLAAAANALVAGGGRAGEVWEELVPVIARVATASGASAADLAQTVLAMVNNLRLGPEQVEQALAGLVQAGKEGQFELRDMAREFASLTAAAAGIGLTGPRAVSSLAAALQVARQGAGSAGEAATNLTNILQKMTSADAVRNFREMGVDLEAVMRSAAERGINPLEALIQKIREVTGGDMFRVQELFADSQVLGFLRPMMQQTADYIRIRDRAAGAMPELITTDQESAMRGLAAALQRLTIAWDEFATRAGAAAEGPLRAAGDLLFWLADAMRGLDERFPGLIDNAATLAAGLVALSAAIAAVGAVAGPLKAALALLASPFVLLGAAVAGVAYYIYKEWERFSGFFEQMGEGLSGIVTGFVENITGLLTGDFARGAEGTMMIWRGLEAFFSGLWGAVRTLFEDFGAWVDGWTGGAVSDAVQAIKAAWNDLIAWFGALWTSVRAPFADFAGWVDGWTGGAVSGAVAAIRAAFQGLTGFFEGLWGTIRAPFADFAGWVDGWTGGAVSAAVAAIRAAFQGLTGFFEGLWATIRAPFEAFIGAVTAAIERVQALVGGVRASVAAGQEAQARLNAQPPVMGNLQQRQAAAAQGLGAGFYGPREAAAAAGAAAQATVGGRIVVEAAPGTTIRQVETANPQVPIQATEQNRGQTRNRP